MEFLKKVGRKFRNKLENYKTLASSKNSKAPKIPVFFIVFGLQESHLIANYDLYDQKV